MNARDERLTPRLVLAACWMAAIYYGREALGWLDRAWPALLIGGLLGIMAGTAGARDQVRECRAAQTPEAAQFACPDWLR